MDLPNKSQWEAIPLSRIVELREMIVLHCARRHEDRVVIDRLPFVGYEDTSCAHLEAFSPLSIYGNNGGRTSFRKKIEQEQKASLHLLFPEPDHVFVSSLSLRP